MCQICNNEDYDIIGLDIEDCSKIQTIDLSKTSILHILIINNCSQITIMYNIPELHHLYITNCPNLEKIPIISGLVNLYIRGCNNITTIPNIPV